jgi:hypothetical protein
MRRRRSGPDRGYTERGMNMSRLGADDNGKIGGHH